MEFWGRLNADYVKERLNTNIGEPTGFTIQIGNDSISFGFRPIVHKNELRATGTISSIRNAIVKENSRNVSGKESQHCLPTTLLNSKTEKNWKT